ncbi:MAG: metallophosphoesterase [candidate division WOR-3 bacterium]
MSAVCRLVHLSDLHLGGGYFVEGWGRQVVDTISMLNPDLLIITGDLTTEGHVHEYEQVIEYLGKFSVARRLIVPGNHDARNEGYMIFEELFGTRYPFFEDGKITVLGLDSSQPDIDDGHIGRSNYLMIAHRFQDRSGLKIVCLHHHLVLIPGTGRERHISTDAGDVLKLLVELDVRIALSGHKHLPWVWHIENTWLITGGTATSRRLKGRSYPSFNLLMIGEREFELVEINVATGEHIRKTGGAGLRLSDLDDFMRHRFPTLVRMDDEINTAVEVPVPDDPSGCIIN